MVLVEDMKYYETLDILRGKKQLSPLYAELKEWLKSEFGITAYNFEFGKMKYDKLNRFRLFIMLASEIENRSMLDGYNYDPRKQTAIAEKIYLLAQKYNEKKLQIYKNVFVCYTDFSYEMKTDFIRQAFSHIEKTLIEKYATYSVWKIVTNFNSISVFYNNETDIKLNSENGINKKIKDEFYEALHQKDEFSIFTYDSFLIQFDSKENIDKNYNGSLFYYFR